MKMNFVLMFMLCANVIAFAQKETHLDDQLKGLDDEIQVLLKQYHAAGLAVAVIQHGETIYTNGFGYRDYENKLPVDENTVFGIGSCTKAFTASVLGILEGESTLSLDDNPSQYLPDLKFAEAGMNDSANFKSGKY